MEKKCTKLTHLMKNLTKCQLALSQLVHMLAKKRAVDVLTDQN
jgi:hypothetical protein